MKSRHIETGIQGERLASRWLKRKRFQILFMNWRRGRGEIDIVAQKDNVLHFIEVKTVRTRVFGYPEEKVDRRKWASWIITSNAFMLENQSTSYFQFDILSVTIFEGQVEYFFIEDALPSDLFVES